MKNVYESIDVYEWTTNLMMKSITFYSEIQVHDVRIWIFEISHNLTRRIQKILSS